MNKKIGLIGSAVTGISVLAFAACMPFSFNFGSYFASMFIAFGYMMMAAAFRSECLDDRRAAGDLGIAFSVAYAVFALLVYFAQTTSVQLGQIPDGAMTMIDYSRFGLFFNYDLLGYGLMALSTFFAGLSLLPSNRGDKALRGMLLGHGVFFLSCFTVPMLGIFEDTGGESNLTGVLLLEVWCAYFLPIAILAFRHFLKAETEGEKK